jgi:hypothetical protein
MRFAAENTGSQESFSIDLLSQLSEDLDIRFRCAAFTAPWSCAISFSLRSGGAGSPANSRDFLGASSLVLLDISSVSKHFPGATKWYREMVNQYRAHYRRIAVLKRRRASVSDYVACGGLLDPCAAIGKELPKDGAMTPGFVSAVTTD